MIKNRVKMIESKRTRKNRPKGFFQVISSEEDLAKAKLQIEAARKEHPNCTIPYLRIILAGALNTPPTKSYKE